MTRRYSRRSARPIEDLPSLFTHEEAQTELIITTQGSPAPTAADREAASEFTIDDSYRRSRNNLRFISFGSGSSGNCAYIGTPSSGLLIDAGVDNNRVTSELARNGIDMRTIRGIVLTHDHADHVKYAYSLLRRNTHMRLFATIKTMEGVLRRHNISRRIKDYHSPIYKEHEYTHGDLTFIPFETSHDGTDNCGYFFSAAGMTFAAATDMGIVTERADYYMRRARALMIESNYDAHMLETGRYTEHLKARIRSPRGHMDNSLTASYISEIYTPSLRHIFLCHLSDDNNTPETAMATAINALRTIDIRPAASSVDIPAGTVYISPLPRYDSSPFYVF